MTKSYKNHVFNLPVLPILL